MKDTNAPVEKRCKDCKKYKPVGKFYTYRKKLATGTATYTYPYCKTCHLVRNRESDLRDIERKNERSRRHYKKHKERVLDKQKAKYHLGKTL